MKKYIGIKDSNGRSPYFFQFYVSLKSNVKPGFCYFPSLLIGISNLISLFWGTNTPKNSQGL